MGVPFIDGYDMYNGLGANVGLASRHAVGQGTGNYMNISLVAGRVGGQAVRIVNDGVGNSLDDSAYVNHVVSALGSFTDHFAIRVNALPTFAPHHCIVYYETAGNGVLWGLRLNPDGTLSALKWNNGGYQIVSTNPGFEPTVFCTTNVPLTLGTWHFLQIECVLSNTAGEIRIYRENDLVAEATGIDNCDTGMGTTLTSIKFGLVSTANAVGATLTNRAFSVDFDDHYVSDSAAKIGERRIETKRVIADTAEKDWSRSTGADNYALLDETLVDSSDYVTASNVGDYDLYEVEDLDSSPSEITAVQVRGFGNKTDGSTRQIYYPMVQGVTKSSGAAVSLPSAVGMIPPRITTVDPNGNPWTTSRFNSIKIGLEVAA